MAGAFYPVIRFPFKVEKARQAWLHLEPIATVYGYGILFKIVLELVGGTGNNKFLYERTIEEFAFTQNGVKDCDMAEAFVEFIEQLYFNKIPREFAVPLAAMFVRIHIPEILVNYGIDLSEYITEVEFEKKEVGFGGNK